MKLVAIEVAGKRKPNQYDFDFIRGALTAFDDGGYNGLADTLAERLDVLALPKDVYAKLPLAYRGMGFHAKYLKDILAGKLPISSDYEWASWTDKLEVARGFLDPTHRKHKAEDNIGVIARVSNVSGYSIKALIKFAKYKAETTGILYHEYLVRNNTVEFDDALFQVRIPRKHYERAVKLNPKLAVENTDFKFLTVEFGKSLSITTK